MSLLIGIVPGIVVASGAQAPAQRTARSDPAADMTGDEQEADHERAWAAYQEKFVEWLSGATSGDVDFHEVERVEIQSLTEGPPPTFGEAIRDAESIVIATVDRVDFLASNTTVVHLDVERTLKGASDSDLTVLQPGGPLPGGADWEGIVLGESEAEPLLLEGDRAILLIGYDGTQNYIHAHSGELRIAGDRVSALETNPARQLLDGKTLDQVIRLVLARLG